MEWYTTKCGKYKIQSLSAATLPSALNLIKEEFCRDECVCIGTEVNKNPVAADELVELCADAALDGTSLVALVTDSGEVVSVIFNRLQLSHSLEKPFFEIFAEERCSQPSSKAVVEFMANLEGRCNLFAKYDADCIFELMFLGTHHDHRKRHLGKHLCRLSLEIARKLRDGPIANITVEDLGPKYSYMKPRSTIAKYPKICQAILTTYATQKILKDLGFMIQLRVPLGEFVYKGKSFIERIGYDPFCEIVVKSLYPLATL